MTTYDKQELMVVGAPADSDDFRLRFMYRLFRLLTPQTQERSQIRIQKYRSQPPPKLQLSEHLRSILLVDPSSPITDPKTS